MVGVLLFKPGSAVASTIERLEDGPAARRFFASGACFQRHSNHLLDLAAAHHTASGLSPTKRPNSHTVWCSRTAPRGHGCLEGRFSVGGGRRVCARELASRVCQPPSPLEFALDEIVQSLEYRTRWIPTRRAAMPPLLPYLRDDELQRFVQRPVSRLPSFQLVDGPIHHSLPSGGVVLLGDSIKAVKPYFGQGANSAVSAAEFQTHRRRRRCCRRRRRHSRHSRCAAAPPRACVG